MYAVVGTLFLATAGVVSAWTYRQFRRPIRSRWTERELPIMAIALAELTLFTSGMTLFGRFLIDVAEQPIGLAEAAMIAAFAATFLLLVALLRVSWRVRRRRRGRVLTHNPSRRAEPRHGRATFHLRRRRGAEPIQSRAAVRGKPPVKREAA